MFSAKMLSQRLGKELLWSAIGFLIVIGIYFVLPESKDDFTEVYAFVLIPIAIIAHLFVSFAAFIKSGTEFEFWQYNKNLFINFILSLVFTGVLTLGVILALLAIQNLFNVDIRGEFYGETAVVFGIVGNTLIFSLFNENGLKYLESTSPYPIVLKFFTQFILIPLLLLYVIILYFYSAKIILIWELPQGWVSYLVLAYSMVGILALLLVHPLKNDTARSWVKIFSKAFYYSLIPLVILLFTAIFTRILEYGYTEPRYYVLLLAIWLLVIQLYFIFSKNATIKFIPMSLVAFGLFGLLFPYANSFAVAKRSQKNQLELLLAENQLLKDGKIQFDKKISSEVALSISDKVNFLSIRDESVYLSKFLSDNIAQKELTTKRVYLMSYFTNVEASPNSLEEALNLSNSEKIHKLDSYDYIVLESKLLNAPVNLGTDEIKLTKELYGEKPQYLLELKSGEKVDLMPKLKGIMDKHKNLKSYNVVDDLFIESDLGKYHIKIIFDEINNNPYDSFGSFYFDNAIYLIKSKNK